MDMLPATSSNGTDADSDCSGNPYVRPGATDTKVQLAISLLLGLTGFVAFCVSRRPVGPKSRSTKPRRR